MLEERDARIAVLEAENAALREALRRIAAIVEQEAWLCAADDAPLYVLDDPYDRPTPIGLTWGHLRRAAAAYPTHSEGGEAASPSPSALTEDRKLDHPAIWLEPVCIGDGRCWSQDGAHTECDCGGEHKPTKYIRADIASALSPKGGT